MYRETYGAYDSDWDRNTAAFADDYEFRAAGTARLPGMPDRWHGREGYLSAHATLLEVIEVERVIFEDLIILPDDRIAAFVRFVIRAGKGTFDQQFLDVHEFRDGALVSQTVWWDRDEGLRELGL